MGADISVEAVAGKLNRVGYEAFIQALRQAKSAGNRNIELAHWLLHILQKDRTDLALTADHFKLDRAKLLADATARWSTASARTRPEMPGISNQVADALDRGWHYATLLFGETQIRTGHLLVAHAEIARAEARAARTSPPEFGKIPADELAAGHRRDLDRVRRRQSAPDGRLGPRRGGRGRRGRRARRQGHDRARPVQPGPHRQSQERRDGPDPRPRRGSPPDRRRADAPAAEQSDPDRRGGRRQDRGRRGLRPAHRVRRRAAAACAASSSALSTSA